VVVRAAVQVDQLTAQVRAISDPFPHILQGIPLDIRSIALHLDKPNFTLNPTSCEPKQITGEAISTLGNVAPLSQRFQVGACNALGFKPNLKINLKGATKRSGHPALKAVLTAKPGEANIAKAVVALPHSVFLAQEHIKTICTRVQFAAKACPAGSVYGRAKAWSPLLDYALEGPVYLRSSSHNLPDLVVALRGPASQPLEIDLDGRIDSIHGGIRNSFEMVPDAPVSKFILEMQGAKKGLLVNSENLCSPKAKTKATVDLIGQNGKVHDFNPIISNSCKSAKKHHKRRSAQR
jgi:hypothetical protein